MSIIKVRFNANYSLVNLYVEKVNKKVKGFSRLAAEMIQDRIKENILRGKRYDGGSVARLAPSTIRRKRGNTSPLTDTFTLYNSIAVKELKATYKVYVKPLRGRFKSKTPRSLVARFLQFGTKFMIARPFWGITKNFISSVIDVKFAQLFR